MGTDRGASIARRIRLGLRPHAAALAAALVVIVAIFALSACNGDSTADIATRAPSTPAATPTATPVLGSPKTIVETAVTACRQQDGELLASLVSTDVSDAELEALFARGRDVQLRSFTFPSEDGDLVTVTVGLLIQRETGTVEVERVWELEQVEDVWRFTSLPDCF